MASGDPPAVSALVVTMPRKSLQRLSELLPPSHEPIPGQFELSLLSPSGSLQHRFTCLHPVFGSLVRCDEQEATMVVDPAGWSGDSDLQLWCYFPADLFLNPKMKKAEVLVSLTLSEDAIDRDFLLLKTHLRSEKVAPQVEFSLRWE